MLDEKSLEVLFTKARSQNGWLDMPVSDETLRDLYDVWKYGPTSANCSPARIVYVRSAAGKARLAQHLIPDNKEKTLAAPVCAVIGHHRQFYDRIPELFPHNPEAREWFSNDAAAAAATAMRNGTLQAAYMMIAARAFGLDVGPMSGFDMAGMEQEFFPDGDVEINFICTIGRGDPDKLFDRLPRLAFEDACELA
ncbi:MAG: malonic semialdehyde reductase [Parvibaculales bacterium]